ncbi:MAG: hypothetical protein CMJ78_24475 [Planctomycetaceae bacterium]|nr:hypothetical protein [Planctomycetaceae bacterium]
MSEQAISDSAFAAFLDQGQLQGSRCTSCEAVFVPPRGWCPKCHQSDMQWTRTSGTGRLFAFSCIAIGPPWMAAYGYDRDHPYCSAVVELDEGPRVVGRLEGVDTNDPENIKIGMWLVLQQDDSKSDDSRICPVFSPV